MNKIKNITVKQAIDRYIESKYAVLSPSTVKGYMIVKRNQLQNLMEVKLSDLNSELYQSAINSDMLKYSPKSISNAVGLVNAAVKMFAPEIRSKLYVTKPQKIKTSFYIPEKDEIDVIYNRIKHSKTDLVKPFLLASQCGLRPSEISALSGDCICKGQIEIKAAIVLDHQGNPIRKAPKTYAGYRSIPISNQMEKTLLNKINHRQQSICGMTAKEIGDQWRKFFDANSDLYYFKFYALRHYYASKCLLMGIPQRYIAELMGHSSTNMIERVYQHVFPSAMQKYKLLLADSMDMILETN